MQSSFFVFVLVLLAAFDAAECSDNDLSLRGTHRNLGAISSFQLINADTNQLISTDLDGAEIDLSVGTGLNIRAVTTGSDVGSVKFLNWYLGGTSSSVENVPPYAMCGDFEGEYSTCTDLVLGTHIVHAIPYSGSDASGTAGTPLTVIFTVVDNGATSPVAPPPVDPPIEFTVPAPTLAPANPPSPSTECKVPQFVGDWESATGYPLDVGESQGAMIGNDFVVVSGFYQAYDQSTDRVFALQVGSSNANWREMDAIPISEGVTHAASVVVGSKLYICGGYLGGHPGPHIPDCHVYDHSKSPGSGQWQSFSPLPDGRAGGGMVYDTNTNSLIFSAGAERPEADAGNADAVDYKHTWMLSLNNINGQWVEKQDIPYLTNHMSFVTSIDAAGNERHFFLAGQMGENEFTGNNDENFEYVVSTDTWVARQSMPFTRGHASSSTRAIGCGFIIAAGSTNEFGKTADVSYYDVPTDTWTSIGELPNSINTPVCVIGTDEYMYCETGWVESTFSYKRKIVLV